MFTYLSFTSSILKFWTELTEKNCHTQDIYIQDNFKMAMWGQKCHTNTQGGQMFMNYSVTGPTQDQKVVRGDLITIYIFYPTQILGGSISVLL